MCSVDCFQLDEILSDLEENKELSSNRLMELERLTVDHQVALKDIQRLKMDVSAWFSVAVFRRSSLVLTFITLFSTLPSLTLITPRLHLVAVILHNHMLRGMSNITCVFLIPSVY